MVLLIVTHVTHYPAASGYQAYMPYVREVKVWGRHADKVIVAAPFSKKADAGLLEAYEHPNLELVRIPAFDLLGWRSVLRALFVIPWIGARLFFAMARATHIHLRCPGNIGLLGCWVQLFFPWKKKTAKYAGNWDPASDQPMTYKWQRRLLSNTFLSRNMQVLVYGQWPDATRNVLPFFTASYTEGDAKISLGQPAPAPYRFVFAGMLVPGKRPLYAIRLIEALQVDCELHLYGDGPLRDELERYVADRGLSSVVIFHGNQPKDVLAEAYRNSHFTILPSQSEGWPKAIAEGMFWGCIPLATRVSCLPAMLGEGDRGLLLSLRIEQDAVALGQLLENPEKMKRMREQAADWSRHYTMEAFDAAIVKLMQA